MKLMTYRNIVASLSACLTPLLFAATSANAMEIHLVSVSNIALTNLPVWPIRDSRPEVRFDFALTGLTGFSLHSPVDIHLGNPGATVTKRIRLANFDAADLIAEVEERALSGFFAKSVEQFEEADVPTRRNPYLEVHRPGFEKAPYAFLKLQATELNRFLLDADPIAQSVDLRAAMLRAMASDSVDSFRFSVMMVDGYGEALLQVTLDLKLSSAEKTQYSGIPLKMSALERSRADAFMRLTKNRRCFFTLQRWWSARSTVYSDGYQDVGSVEQCLSTHLFVGSIHNEAATQTHCGNSADALDVSSRNALRKMRVKYRCTQLTRAR